MNKEDKNKGQIIDLLEGLLKTTVTVSTSVEHGHVGRVVFSEKYIPYQNVKRILDRLRSNQREIWDQ